MTFSKLSPEHIIKSVYSSPFNQYKNNLGLVLDVSYITDNIIVCSYPVMKYPKMFYRNSLADLILYLDANHGRNNWKMYNLKVETNDSDYTDEDFAMVLELQNHSTEQDPTASSLRSRRMLEEHCKTSSIRVLYNSSRSMRKPPISVSAHLLRGCLLYTSRCV